jgi:predicted nucleotidyltransferase
MYDVPGQLRPASGQTTGWEIDVKFAAMSEARATETGLAEIVERNLPALAELCRRFGVRRLDLFGSAATGHFDPARSDLDFLVEFEPMPPSPYAKACRGLREGLQRLFGRSVDLLTVPALVNPYLRRQIELEKRTLYPSS